MTNWPALTPIEARIISTKADDDGERVAGGVATALLENRFSIKHELDLQVGEVETMPILDGSAVNEAGVAHAIREPLKERGEAVDACTAIEVVGSRFSDPDVRRLARGRPPGLAMACSPGCPGLLSNGLRQQVALGRWP